MVNKPLKERLKAKIVEIRQTHSTNNNSIFSCQAQINALFDLLELVIADEDVQLAPRTAAPAARAPQMMPGHAPQGYAPQGYAPPGYAPPGYNPGVFAGMDRPPTVQEAETMEIPATNETQIFMTHKGTKVIPPAYTGVPPFVLAPGAEIPRFPSYAEAVAMAQGQAPAPVVHPPGYRLGIPVAGAAPAGAPAQGFAGAPVGVPSNVTVPGVHPSGAPPGLSMPAMPAVPGAVAVPIPGVPLGAVTSAQSVALPGPAPGSLIPGGIPAELSHMLGENTIVGDPAGGARNITGPVNAFPGGAVITE